MSGKARQEARQTRALSSVLRGRQKSGSGGTMAATRQLQAPLLRTPTGLSAVSIARNGSGPRCLLITTPFDLAPFSPMTADHGALPTVHRLRSVRYGRPRAMRDQHTLSTAAVPWTVRSGSWRGSQRGVHDEGTPSSVGIFPRARAKRRPRRCRTENFRQPRAAWGAAGEGMEGAAGCW